MIMHLQLQTSKPLGKLDIVEASTIFNALSCSSGKLYQCISHNTDVLWQPLAW